MKNPGGMPPAGWGSLRQAACPAKRPPTRPARRPAHRAAGIVARCLEAGPEERAHAALDSAKNLLHVLVGRRRQRQEANAAKVADPYAIRDDGMEMDVEIQRAAKSLHESDGSRTCAAEAQPAGAQPVTGKDGAQGQV